MARDYKDIASDPYAYWKGREASGVYKNRNMGQPRTHQADPDYTARKRSLLDRDTGYRPLPQGPVFEKKRQKRRFEIEHDWKKI